MADSKYEDILHKSWDEIPEPKVLPTGSWLLDGRNAAYIPKKDDDADSKAKVLFFYEADTPMEDVDDDQLAALGDYDFANTDLTAQFFIERDKDWDRVRKHLALHDIDTKGKDIPDSLKAFHGSKVIAFLDERTYKDKKTGKMVTVNSLTDFAPVD